MQTEPTPTPCTAWKSPHDGHWFVVNRLGGLEYEAESKADAEEIAADLNEHAARQHAEAHLCRFQAVFDRRRT